MALALGLVGLLGPAGSGRADAATLYAAAGGSTTPGCPSSAPCALTGVGGALAQAASLTGRDTVEVLGPLSLTTLTSVDLATDSVDLVGSGSGAGGTFIDATLVRALDIGPNSSVRGVRARSGAAADAVRVAPGATLSDVAIEASAVGADGVVVAGAGTGPVTASSLSILLPTTGAGAAIDASASAASLRLSDSTVRAPVGIDSAGQTTLARVTLLATGAYGLDVSSGGAVVSSSIIRALGAGTTGIRVHGGAGAVLRNLTIDGSLASGASVGMLSSDGGTVVDARAVVARGFATAAAVAAGGTLRLADSDVEASGVGVGVDTGGGGIIDLDPRWRDALAGDYHLRAVSPLVDRVEPTPPVTGESITDRDGHLRFVDGNGDGDARRDIGAYERRPPTARITFRSPASVGSSITLDGQYSDYPDGEIVRYKWDVDGNGSYETDTDLVPQVVTKYAAPARVVVRLQVTGDDGATDTVAKTLVVVDSTPPRFVSARVTPTRFAPARTSTVLTAARRGTTFQYQVSESATVQIKLQRVTTGRRVDGVCKARAAVRKRAAAPCRLLIASGTLVRRKQPPTLKTLAFTGRLRGRALKPGSYVAVLKAVDVAGNQSAERRLSFRILAG